MDSIHLYEQGYRVAWNFSTVTEAKKKLKLEENF